MTCQNGWLNINLLYNLIKLFLKSGGFKNKKQYSEESLLPEMNINFIVNIFYYSSNNIYIQLGHILSLFITEE